VLEGGQLADQGEDGGDVWRGRLEMFLPNEARTFLGCVADLADDGRWCHILASVL
jgi:hypothetical protein